MSPPMASMAFAVGLPDRKDRAKVAKKRISIEAKHKLAVEHKKQKVGMLKALVLDLDSKEAPSDADLERLRDLKRRLRTAESQLAVMRP